MPIEPADITGPPDLTLFSIPRAFSGHTGVIQTNAIRSWARLPRSEVMLFGAEEGIGELTHGLGVRHEPEISSNALGTPLLSDAFARARRLATSPIVAYVNADIMFTSDLLEAVAALARAPFRSWVMVGQRRDVDISELIDLDRVCEQAVLQDVALRGALHGKAGIDFVVFPRKLPIEFPPMAVGRPGWDSWLVYAVRKAGIPLVDATGVLCAIHQNHPSGYDPDGAEARTNRAAAGGYYRMGTLRDADWHLIRAAAGGIELHRRWAGVFWFSSPIRAALALRRRFTSRVG